MQLQAMGKVQFPCVLKKAQCTPATHMLNMKAIQVQHQKDAEDQKQCLLVCPDEKATINYLTEALGNGSTMDDIEMCMMDNSSMDINNDEGIHAHHLAVQALKWESVIP
ncbi:hypothetical protein DACRYDRAFT_107296 [Dacryopinax primogenitus]|uniref:Uncharacterized protein n=1 Tax=Dacryopinax primogenitus (strain DJM 731) TaxID=1858805 RepID=M5G2C9_DACPD|nr:uncharacterized protein DACRYDRAFT_107296 [Dacryopinax primogenitus]EJU02370.1 hypothetical protein DACRYDRAFT_107296 [Dacryopinax primogenitus]